MCIDIVSGSRKPYGFLFKNDLNEFVYTCSRCDDEFRIGLDLEHHIIGHDVKEENENEALDHCELPIELAPIEVLPPPTPPLPPIQPPFDPSGDCKSEVIAVDCSTKDEMGIYLPFDTPKLEINIEEKETHDEDEAETANAMDDDFPSNDFQADSSSSSDDFFPPPKSKKKPQKKTNKTNKSNKESKKKTYHCEICSRVFTSLARIKQHMIAGHVKKKKPVKRPLSPTLCTLCGKYIRDMKPHLKVFHSTERPFKCDYCDATFKQKVHRDTHVRQHTGEKPYICHLCGRSYHAQSVLNAHMNRYHLHLKPHKCDRCGNSYRQLYELRDHINLHHLNQKMYPCDVCNRRFGTRKHLHQHMLSHGEKRFQCKFCDQKFATTSGRRGHEIRNHGAI